MVPKPVGKIVVTANYSTKEFWSEMTCFASSPLPHTSYSLLKGIHLYLIENLFLCQFCF